MHLPAPFLLLLLLLAVVPPAKGGVAKDPSAHVATEEQLVMRSPDGGVRFAVDTSDSYRAEIRTPTGTVKGIYSWMRPDGTSKTVSYSANPQVGFQAVPFGQLGVELPPFPERLNTGKNQVEKEEDEDFVVVDRGHQFYSSAAAYPWPYAYIPVGSLAEGGFQAIPTDKNAEDHKDFSDPETDSVIVGEEAPCDAENPEDCVADEDEDEEPLPGFPGGIPIVIPGAGGGMTLLDPEPGQDVAQSIPSASAVAGDFGIATAGPGSTAFVGPGGIALALPNAQAAAGAGGMAISVPTATAQAGVGGIAIAGGQSLALAGDYDPQAHGIGGGSQVDFEVKDLGRSGVGNGGGGVGIYPIIANYYFYPPPSAGSGGAPGGEAGDHQQQRQPTLHQSYFYNLHPANLPYYLQPEEGALTYYGAARRFGSVPVPAGEEEKTESAQGADADDSGQDGKSEADGRSLDHDYADDFTGRSESL